MSDYLDRLAGQGGQITSMDELPADPGELTAAQLRQLIREIDLQIVNMRRERRGNFANYSIGGAAGRSVSPAESISTLLELRKVYHDLLLAVPVAEEVLYDSPDIPGD